MANNNNLIGWKNRAEAATLASATPMQTAWPYTYAVSRRLRQAGKAKPSARRQASLTLDLGATYAEQPVRLATLTDHLLGSAGRYRIQASNLPLLEDPALLLDFLATETDGRTWPNKLDGRITFGRASGGTLWRDGVLFGAELVTVSATALTTSATGWTVAAGGKWQAGDPVYVLPQDGTANMSLTATVQSYAGTTLSLESVTAGSDTTTTKTAFVIVYRGPRLDSDPVTKARRGLLVEGAGTNAATFSEDSSTDHVDNGWALSNAGRTGAAAVAPNGATTATLLTASGGAGAHGVTLRRGTIASPYDSAVSVFVKAKGTHQVSLAARADTTTHGYSAVFDLRTGTVVSTTASASGTLNGTFIEPLPDGWFRIGVSANHTSASNGLGVVAALNLVGLNGSTTFTPDGTEAESVYAWGWQIEVNKTFLSSYIWAGSAARTRAADVATISGSNFTSWFVQGPGSLAVDGVPSSAVAGQAGLVALSDGTTGEEFRISFDGSGNLDFDVVDGSSSQASIDSGDDAVAGKTFRAAVAWAGNDFAIAASGKATVTDTAGSLPAPDEMMIGAIGDGSASLFGWIRTIAYWPRRLADARLVALTNRGATINADFTACSVDLPDYFTFSRASGGTYIDSLGRVQGYAPFVVAATAAGTGSKSWPVGAGQDWKVGQSVRATPQDGTANMAMIGKVTAYSGAILTVNVIATGSDRSTTKTDWIVGLAGPRFTHDADGTALGLLVEPAATNLLLNATAPATQAVTTSAVAYTLSFHGTGTVTLSGTSADGPLVGTGAADRVSLTFTPSAGTLTLTVSGTVEYGQLETGSVATSWIWTGSASRTRSADVCTIEGDEFAARYRQDEGAIFAGYTSLQATAGLGAIFVARNAAASNRWQVTPSNSSVVASSSSQANVAYSPSTTGARIAAALKVNDLAAYVDGTLAGADNSLTMPTGLTVADIGRFGFGGAESLRGTISRLIYWPERVANADLVDITTAGADLSGYTIPGDLSDAYAGTYDSGKTAAWQAGQARAKLEAVFDANQTYRYWRIDQMDLAGPEADPGTADDAVTLEWPYLGLWQGWQPGHNRSYGSSRERVSRTEVLESLSGAEEFGRRAGHAARQLLFKYLTRADLAIFDALMEYADIDTPIYYLPDPAATGADRDQAMLCRLERLSSMEEAYHHGGTTGTRVKQWIG